MVESRRLPTLDGRKVMSRALYAALVVTAACCTYNMRRADPDLFGYLTYGRLFVDAGGPVSADPFAYTSSGMDWVAFEYGAQTLFWLSYRVAGALGLIGLKCVVGAACAFFVYVAVKEAAGIRC